MTSSRWRPELEHMMGYIAAASTAIRVAIKAVDMD